jgi:hypothetical protein
MQLYLSIERAGGARSDQLHERFQNGRKTLAGQWQEAAIRQRVIKIDRFALLDEGGFPAWISRKRKARDSCRQRGQKVRQMGD